MRFGKLAWLAVLAAFATGATAQVPRSHHVIVLTLENHSYEQVIGNAQMPYFNHLAAKYGLCDHYYATSHNSLTALMWLTAGAPVTQNDNTMEFFNVDNIVRQMQQDGRSWKVYAGDLPSTGYLGFNVGEYVKRHNPIAYFTDVQSSLRRNIVPLDPNFQQDIEGGTLPEYAYVTPNLVDDAHNGTLAQADRWLSANIPQLLSSGQFQRDGILLIVWDEGNINPVDTRGNGGRVATLVVGPGVTPGFNSEVRYNHQSLLKTTCLALGLSGCPGGGATGVPMADFFGNSGQGAPQINLISPLGGSTSSPIHIEARGIDGDNPATGMAAYVGNVLVTTTNSPSISVDYPVASGTYVVTIRVWDSTGQFSNRQSTITVK